MFASELEKGGARWPSALSKPGLSSTARSRLAAASAGRPQNSHIMPRSWCACGLFGSSRTISLNSGIASAHRSGVEVPLGFEEELLQPLPHGGRRLRPLGRSGGKSRARLFGLAAVLELSAAAARAGVVAADLCRRDGRDADCAHSTGSSLSYDLQLYPAG